MATQAEQVSQLQAVKALQTKTAGEIAALQAQIAALTATNGTLTSQNTSLTQARDALIAEKAALVLSNQALTQQVADLQAQLAALPPPSSGLPDATPELVQAVNDVLAGAQANDALITDGSGVTPPPPPPPPSDVFLRPAVATNGPNRKWYSEGLGTYDPAVSGDFSSTQGQAILQPDDATKIGVARVTVSDMSNGAPMFGPTAPWNGAFYPDVDAARWGISGNAPLSVSGQPIAIARGYGRWANTSFILTDKGLIGTAGTVTAVSPWSDYLLPANKKATAIAVTSGTELVLVTTIDTVTGNGELAVLVIWGGEKLKILAGGDGFYHDWQDPHPGLASPGIVCGMKLLGFVDLGLNAPSGVQTMTNRTSDRVNNKTDGNAGSLHDYDLSVQADRDSFFSGSSNSSGAGSNPNYIATSGSAVVFSQTENKAVLVDLTPFFAGMRTQYLTTQALYDVTKANFSGAYWQAYSQDETLWPQGFTTRPDLKPTVKATIPVTAPTSALLHWNSDGIVAIGTAVGMLHFFDKNMVEIGTPLSLGANLCALAYDKYLDGIRFGGLFALSRTAKTIYRVSSWTNPAVTMTITDSRMVDPVGIEVADTHGIDVGLLQVADNAGKQLLTYRYTDFKATNFGGTVYPIEAGAPYECEGVLPLPGKVLGFTATNVN